MCPPTGYTPEHFLVHPVLYHASHSDDKCYKKKRLRFTIQDQACISVSLSGHAPVQR